MGKLLQNFGQTMTLTVEMLPRIFMNMTHDDLLRAGSWATCHSRLGAAVALLLLLFKNRPSLFMMQQA